MEIDQRLVSDQTRIGRHSRGTVRVLFHHGAHVDAAGHAKFKSPKGVQSESAVKRRDLYRAGRPDQSQIEYDHSQVRGGHTAADDQHAHLAADHPEQSAVRVGHIHGLLERPESEARAVHDSVYGQRVGTRGWTVGVRVLFLRTADGSRGHHGRRTHVPGRR